MDQDDKSKEVFIDGQLSFKIRKTKNQDVMRKSMQNFKRSLSPKRKEAPSKKEFVGKKQ